MGSYSRSTVPRLNFTRFKMTATKVFKILCVSLIFLVSYAQAHNITDSTNKATNPTVPLLDLKQILEIGNPSIPPTPNHTTTTPPVPSTTTVTTTTSSTTTTTPSTTTTTTTTQVPPSTTTTLSTSPSTTAKTTPSTSTSTASSSTTVVSPGPQPLRSRPSSRNHTTTTTKPAISSTTTTAPTTTTASTTTTATTTTTSSTTITEIPETSAAVSVPDPEIVSSSAPEALRKSPTTTQSTTPPTTTTTTTTTTAAPRILGPPVKLTPGEVRPLVLRSRKNNKYYAFRGIKYAIPPVYFQRFKDPGPVAPWGETFEATSYGPSCIQYNILSGEVEGEEDCLTLNIFTNSLPRLRNRKKELYPVMVFFHQGAFMFGTSKDFEEKYFMDEDVVLVTVQYRLGAFGFLNTQGDSDAKGNQGLKDQLLALKFIRDEIHNFNGQKDSVLIFGESAGASSVHYHLLSDKSRGLFNRAISMSGTALSPWAFTRSPKKMAKKLATLLNCPTTDMNELFICLQGHDARVIADKTKELYEWNTDPITPFAPSIENEESLNSFLTESPYNLMKKGRINDAPWILGVVENVCMLDAWSVLVDKQLTDDMNVDWHRVAPTTFLFKDTALEPDAVSNQIRAYYFGTKDIGNDTAQDLEHLYSDRYFNHGIRTSALMHVRTNEAIPVYLYIFSYKGTQSHTKFAGISDVLGVSEGDELRFLFNTNRFDDIPLNSTDGDISQKFVKLWVSFAQDGKPTAVWGDQEWTRIGPAQVKGDEALMYYSLNTTCGFIEEPFSSRMNFWDTLPLNENDNELINLYNIHQKYPEESDDIFNRFG